MLAHRKVKSTATKMAFAFPTRNTMTGAHDEPLRHVHGCRKHHDEKVASSKKKKKEPKTRVQKIDTLFIIKMAAKWLKSISLHT